MSEESHNEFSDLVPEDSDLFSGEETIHHEEIVELGEEFEEPSAIDGSQTAANRPASGARQVSPGEVLSMDFQASENAGDFLGLDLEFTETAGDGGELDLVQPPMTGGGTGGAGGSGAATADDEYVGEYGDVYEGDELDDGFDDSDDYGEFDSEEYSEEGYEDEYGEDFLDELETEASPRSRRGLFVGVAAFAAVATVAGVFLGPKLFPSGGDEIARGVVRIPTPPVGTDPVVPDPVDLANVDPVDPVDSGSDPLDTDPGATGDPLATGTDPDPIDTASTDPTDVEAWLPGGQQDPDPSDPFDIFDGVDPAPIDEGSDPIQGMTEQLAGLFGLGGGPDPMEEFPDFEDGFEWVTEDMLDMIWRGSEVPMEAIYAPARTLMPRVGLVLVHMDSGEVFQGKLYAVGQGKVWLDTNPGRVGLDGAGVERFEPIPAEAAALVQGQVVTGERVRAQVPGGWLYGRVLARGEGEGDVTMVSDDGARVRLRDAQIEPLQQSRPVIVRN